MLAKTLAALLLTLMASCDPDGAPRRFGPRGEADSGPGVASSEDASSGPGSSDGAPEPIAWSCTRSAHQGKQIWTCDGDALYRCTSGIPEKRVCPLGCIVKPPGTDDECKAGPGPDGGAAASPTPSPPPTPPTSVLSTIAEIVGGKPYTICQKFGPSTVMNYSYCTSYGTPAGVNYHCGVDICVPRGTPMYSPGAGTVTFAGGGAYFQDSVNKAAGQLSIKLGDGTIVILGHSSEISVKLNQAVKQQELVGKSGTFNGPHIHLEVRVPDKSLASGYRAVDPVVFFGK